MWFKSCPKCKSGDLHLDRDTYGKFQRCIQCGFIRDVAAPAVPTTRPATPYLGALSTRAA